MCVGGFVLDIIIYVIILLICVVLYMLWVSFVIGFFEKLDINIDNFLGNVVDKAYDLGEKLADKVSKRK